MKALVAYYTRTGSTKKLAESICSSLNCDIEEIVDLKNRKGIFGFMSSGYDACRKKLTDIKPPEKDASAYDLVIIGTPIWAGAMAPAVRTYLTQLKSKNALADRKMAFFCAMGGTDGEKVLSSLASLAGKNLAASMAWPLKKWQKASTPSSRTSLPEHPPDRCEIPFIREDGWLSLLLVSMRAIIFYYSRTGTTKAVANAISATLNCDVEEIVDCRGRGGSLGYIKSSREAHEMRFTEIKQVKNDLSLYGTVIIGTSIWSGIISCAVRTFTSQFQQALASKNLAFFCTMGGSGNEDALEEMAALCDRAPVATSAFRTGEVKSKNFLAPVSQFTSEILRFLQF